MDDGNQVFRVNVLYKNWRGETALRTVRIIREWYGETDFHRGDNLHFLEVWDEDRQMGRDYHVPDIIGWKPIINNGIPKSVDGLLPVEHLLMVFRSWQKSKIDSEALPDRT